MGDICNICGEPCSSVPWIHDRCYEAMLVELSELRAELGGQITGTWQPVMPGYNMMIHLNHPCVGWDILVTPIGLDEEVLRGQGYIGIAEVITLAQQADKLRAALERLLRLGLCQKCYTACDDVGCDCECHLTLAVTRLAAIAALGEAE